MALRKENRPHQEILRLQKQIYLENQKKIHESVEVLDKDFRRYEANYLKAVRNYQKVAYIPEVEHVIRESNIIFIGDYHTLDQSQRSFVRVLRSYFQTHEKDVVVALEIIQARYQMHLDKFMNGGLDEKSFVRKIGFKKHWSFDLWDNYKVIFDFLKHHDIPVIAIEATAGSGRKLLERDQFMARRIVQAAKMHPDKKIFVLVGDLHLAPQHLPKAVKVEAKKQKISVNLLSLYQNSPDIYWKLVKKNRIDQTLLVKISDTEFCRMHTSPILAQQSYLNWVYQEDRGFDWVDAKGSFLDMVRQISRIVGVDLPKDYDQIEVHTSGNLGFMRKLSLRKLYSPRELKVLREQVLNSVSCFMPKARMVYLANVSINHAAEEASQYIKYLLSGPDKVRGQRDAFYAGVLLQVLGFFGSKLVNAKRKCARYQDFQHELQYLKSADLIAKRYVEFQTAELFLQHREIVRKGDLFGEARIASFSRELFQSLIHAIGHDVGEHLYHAFMAGHISKSEIQELYANPFLTSTDSAIAYLKTLDRLKTFKRPPKEI